MKARNTWILSRLMLKNAAAGLNPFMTQEKSSGRSKAKGIFVILMVLMAMASMIFLELEIFSLLKKIGQPGVLPGVAIMLGMLVTFQAAQEITNAEIRLRSDDTGFVNELADIAGVESAVLVSYNGDYMG